MMKVGIFGATGYAGQQLVTLLGRHPNVCIEFISSNTYAGKKFCDVYPHFKNVYTKILISMHEAMDLIGQVDVVFTALPHGGAFEVAKAAMAQHTKHIDLGADFRLDDQSIYEEWYKTNHTAADLIPSAVYGLPELWRDRIKGACLVANPGCYTTASILALAPLLAQPNLVNPTSIIIDAKSGITGAGRKEDYSLLLAEATESIKAYGIASHRHTPEIEQELTKMCSNPDDKVYVTFTPHLLPIKRGILSTCYIQLTSDFSIEEAYALYEKFYAGSPFVRLRRENVETRFVCNTNYCDISINLDARTKRMIITSAIDNLMKGAAGQAVQNMNIIFDLEESMGLENLWPIAP